MPLVHLRAAQRGESREVLELGEEDYLCLSLVGVSLSRWGACIRQSHVSAQRPGGGTEQVLKPTEILLLHPEPQSRAAGSGG